MSNMPNPLTPPGHEPERPVTPERLRPFSAVRDRYQNDTMFSHLVDMMRACIERAEFTPTEIREAAMLAQIVYEETHIRPIVFTRQDVIDRKV